MAIESFKKLEAEGKIDPLENLSRSAVYIYSGKRDVQFPPERQYHVLDFYEYFKTKVAFQEMTLPHIWSITNHYQ